MAWVRPSSSSSAKPQPGTGATGCRATGATGSWPFRIVVVEVQAGALDEIGRPQVEQQRGEMFRQLLRVFLVHQREIEAARHELLLQRHVVHEIERGVEPCQVRVHPGSGGAARSRRRGGPGASRSRCRTPARWAAAGGRNPAGAGGPLFPAPVRRSGRSARGGRAARWAGRTGPLFSWAAAIPGMKTCSMATWMLGRDRDRRTGGTTRGPGPCIPAGRP